eukprot:scaffold4729_cov145-Isochrysis_galbana.AAC.2
MGGCRSQSAVSHTARVTCHREQPASAVHTVNKRGCDDDLHQFITHPFNLLPMTLEQRPHGVALESSRGFSTQPIDIGGDSPLVTLPPWT